MRDILVVILLLGGIALAFRAPWLGVLVLAFFGYMNPHTYAWGFSQDLPVYLLLFLAVGISFLINGKDRQPIPADWRIPAFYFLWFWFFITTLDALNPGVAWPKLVDVSKIYLPLIFTLILINTREKLYYLIIVIAASFGLIAVKGGIFALSTGFAYHTLGPYRSHFGGNNEFAIATLMAIPLVILWLRETTDKRLKVVLMGAVPLMFASAISSQSRGALVAMGVLIPLLLWNSKRKYLAAPALILGVVLALQFLPAEWFARMNTIRTYEEDASAMMRIEAWKDGIAYAFLNPITGGGFNAWVWITNRDWHSTYVEAVAEHGFVGLFVWASLVFGTMLSLTRLLRIARKAPEISWVKNYASMLRASLAAYAAGGLFLGITYWDLIYHLVFISVLVKEFALKELAQHAKRAAPVPLEAGSANVPSGSPARGLSAGQFVPEEASRR
jgi:probable O-glycosylation ligase (exosortase A-associated)